MLTNDIEQPGPVWVVLLPREIEENVVKMAEKAWRYNYKLKVYI